MRYVALMTVTYEAADQRDADHLREVMRGRLDELTPESTTVKAWASRPITTLDDDESEA